MKKDEITISEWQAALREASQDDEGMTMVEIAAKMKCGMNKARRLIGILAGKGLVKLGRKTITNIAGVSQLTTVYSIKKGGGK